MSTYRMPLLNTHYGLMLICILTLLSLRYLISHPKCLHVQESHTTYEYSR